MAQTDCLIQHQKYSTSSPQKCRARVQGSLVTQTEVRHLHSVTGINLSKKPNDLISLESFSVPALWLVSVKAISENKWCTWKLRSITP